ncbi:MAG TPA: hypothetical protein VGP64_04245 [Polyangia bacterium]
MSSYALYTLRDLRLAAEKQAERSLGTAAATLRAAEAEAERLRARLAETRAAEAAARAANSPAVTALAAQTERRFWARLAGERQAAAEAIERHRADVIGPAARAEAAARDAHLRTRQRREVVEKAIARREAAVHRDRERRGEAAADDLGQRRRK